MPELSNKDANSVRTAYELSAALLSVVIAIAIGWWFGRTLDRWLGIAPWATWVFVIFGFVAGALNVYRAVQRAIASPKHR